MGQAVLSMILLFGGRVIGVASSTLERCPTRQRWEFNSRRHAPNYEKIS